MKTLTIDRAKWSNGKNLKPGVCGMLYSAMTGKYCILGFYLDELGLLKKDLVTVTSPGDLEEESQGIIPEEANWLLDMAEGGGAVSSGIANVIMKWNDDRTKELREIEREITLTKLLWTQGIELIFEGELE